MRPPVWRCDDAGDQQLPRGLIEEAPNFTSSSSLEPACVTVSLRTERAEEHYSGGQDGRGGHHFLVQEFKCGGRDGRSGVAA